MTRDEVYAWKIGLESASCILDQALKVENPEVLERLLKMVSQMVDPAEAIKSGKKLGFKADPLPKKDSGQWMRERLSEPAKPPFGLRRSETSPRLARNEPQKPIQEPARGRRCVRRSSAGRQGRQEGRDHPGNRRDPLFSERVQVQGRHIGKPAVQASCRRTGSDDRELL